MPLKTRRGIKDFEHYLHKTWKIRTLVIINCTFFIGIQRLCNTPSRRESVKFCTVNQKSYILGVREYGQFFIRYQIACNFLLYSKSLFPWLVISIMRFGSSSRFRSLFFRDSRCLHVSHVSFYQSIQYSIPNIRSLAKEVCSFFSSIYYISHDCTHNSSHKYLLYF